MNVRTPQQHLPRLIGRYARTAMSNRQVARRLWSLLPDRYRELKWEHVRLGGKVARRERQALTDLRYEALVRELADMNHAALTARVEYETHAMLYWARQSLRGVTTAKVR